MKKRKLDYRLVAGYYGYQVPYDKEAQDKISYQDHVDYWSGRTIGFECEFFEPVRGDDE